MRLNKPNAASAPARPGATVPPGAGRRSRRRWFVLGGLVLLAGLAGWGAWSLSRSDPLAEARAALDRRDFRTADELLANRLAEHPNDRPARLLAARAARRGGDYSSAFEHLRQYRNQGGADAASDLEAALLRAHTGDTAEADRLFAECAGRPDAPDTPFVMEAYLEGKLKVLAPRADAQVDAAAADPVVVANFKRAVELWLAARPGRADQAQGRVWRARVLIFANDHAGGVAALREALGLDPDHFEARFNLALALAQQSPDEARRHLETLRDAHPKNHYVRFGLAGTYRMLGRTGDARAVLEGLVGGPAELPALVELAQIDLDEENPGAAERRLRSVLERSPNLPEANLALSRCLLLTGRPAEAAKYRTRFDELDAERKKPHPPAPPLPR